MGKEGFLTPKAISNRIKAKGLQKLKFYCQMCEKQCRDANGFKCHCQSESHRRQMELVASGQKKFIDTFSIQFERNFMGLVSTRFRSRRVKANTVYNEYIQDKTHVHMNSTRWGTLTEFVLYLHRTEKVVADETPKGWYIKFIDKEALVRQRELEKKNKAELNAEERSIREIKKQRERAVKLEEKYSKNNIINTSNKPINIPDKISISLETKNDKNKITKSIFNEEEEEDNEKEETKNEKPETTKSIPQTGKKRSIDELYKKEDKQNQTTPPKKKQKLANWLYKDIIVKVILKSLASGKYYKQKGIILQVVDKFGAKVKMIKSGDIILLDQEHIETVIPAIGGKIKVVNGEYRGEKGILKSLDIKKYSGNIKLQSSSEIIELPYEYFSKSK